MRALIALGLVLCPASSALPQDPKPLAPQQLYAKDVRQLTKVVRRSWSYLAHRREHSGLDLGKLEAEALAGLTGKSTKVDFLKALTRYVAALQDGHAFVSLTGVTLPGKRRWPFSVVDAAEGVMIDGVEKSIAEAGKLRRGDILLGVDGEPIDAIVREAERMVFASSDRARRSSALARMVSRVAKQAIRVRIRRIAGGEAGGAREIDIDLACPPVYKRVAAPSRLPITREWKMLDGGIGYFRPGRFTARDVKAWRVAKPAERGELLAADYAQFRRVFTELAGAKAMILDLRGNPGGTDLLGQALAGHLMKPGFTFYALQSKRLFWWGSKNTIRPDVSASKPRFLGRLVCLIDERAFSAADNLAACLRDEHPDVTFVGRPTGAGTGAPRSFDLPGTGAKVTFCTMRVYSPGGHVIEGAGVKPDVAVEFSRAHHLAGRDADMEAALALLRR